MDEDILEIRLKKLRDDMDMLAKVCHDAGMTYRCGILDDAVTCMDRALDNK